MSLLHRNLTTDLNFKNKNLHIYPLARNSILFISEIWEYIFWDGTKNNIRFKGTLPEEDKTTRMILNEYSYWFELITQEKMIYYSYKSRTFKIYDFLNKKICEEWSEVYFDIKIQTAFFVKLIYNSDLRRVRILHMIDPKTARICDIYADGKIEEVDVFEIFNPNFMSEFQKTLLFSGSNYDKNSLVIHTLNNWHHNTITFNWDDLKENITIVEIAMLKQNILLLLYNHNEREEAGLFIINLINNKFKTSSKFTALDQNCQRVKLFQEENPEILDGRIIIDKFLNNFIVVTLVSFFL